MFFDRSIKVSIVLDNHSAHVSNKNKDTFKTLNFEPLFMPPYSPGFNSIGKYFS